MSALWTRAALERITGGESHGLWTEIHGLSIDTRSLRRGDLFVALKDRRDGHDFVPDALRMGASAALVSRVPLDLPPDAGLLLVEDTLFALETIADAARDRARTAKVIAVTGSVGKTSVKQALEWVLAAQGKTHASEKSFNNHWGVPLTLARMPDDTGFGVFEIGMNHSGEITPLTRMVRPHIAIVTTVAPVHLGNFRNEREIAEAKAEILDGVQTGGIALLNRDNRWFDLLAGRAAALGLDVVSFGADDASKARLLQHVQQSETATLEADILGERVLCALNAPGRHMALNAVAVLAAVRLAGADLARAALALGRWQPGDGRGARRRIRLDPIDPSTAFTLIDESYNANPLSVAAALETLALAETAPDRSGRPGRRIAVLGDMLELGETSEEMHAGLAKAPHMADADLVYCCGPHMRALFDSLASHQRGEWAGDSRSLAAILRRSVRSGDAVMVKGSLGSRMAEIVEQLETLGRVRKSVAMR